MDPRPAHFSTAFHEVILIFITCMAQFLCQGGITMSLSTMELVLDSFAGPGNQVDDTKKVWFMGSFALTVGTFILVSGRLGDLFGLKQIFTIGWFWCTVWSLVTGLSTYLNSVIFFIVCRAFHGIGFALLLPCAMGILGSVYPNGSRKNLAFGLVGASGPTGATIGALMAAVVAQLAWWPWAFWILAIVCFIFGVLLIYYIPPNLNANKYTWKQAWDQLDVLGTCTGVCGLILLNFVWNQGPVVGWKNPYIIVLLVLAVVLIVGFFYLERTVASPLLPASIFNVKIGLVLLCMGLGWGSFGVWQYYYWNLVMNLRHYTPIEGGLSYIPFLVLGVIASMIVSVIISRTKPSYIICFSSVCFMCGCIVLSVTPVVQSYYRMTMGQMFILCWAMDMSFPAAAIILSNYLPYHHQGMAGSLVSTVVNYSVSLFLGIATTVELEVRSTQPDPTSIDSILKTYRAALYFGIGVAGLGVLFSLIFIYLQHDDTVGTIEEDEKLETSGPSIDSL
ncbi:major facilitator superfamily MFS-1 [Suhomyces tanzawaensis NRRL Y-17324]|uniref:Major facilitator superfamily MFS-1 n=1 Tax=Suhomyces tanzawaensis NRRL Y-17324 TaxID=984487 RepID=A0A1E4SLS5_9ASCO|nr:major facilitator superfamily MFS-1 [Suhomyces tanzawaensis NRRL Y-17324]ODV80473.1 major facilitator superfamily MFS-1 [Suhomyces tanzawaensis NRRL Y-17324]